MIAMKRDGIKCVSLAAALLSAVTMYAKETSWTDSRANDWDWTNPANFTSGKPETGDTVVIPENMVVYATNDTARTLLNTLAYINLQGKRTSASNVGTSCILVIDVPAEGIYELRVAFHEASDTSARGIVRKTGDGELALATLGNVWKYRTDFDVQAGVLNMHNLKDVAYRIGAIGIAEGATVVGPDYTMFAAGVYGAGLLTNQATSERYFRTIGGTASNPYMFSGKISGKMAFRTYGAQYLTGSNNVNQMCSVYSPSLKTKGVLGVPYFGNRDSESSSIGLSQNLQFLQYGGKILYLGTGETTDKGIKIYEDGGLGQAVIDGGVTGGLTINGTIDFPNKMMVSLVLEGNHKAPCAFGGNVTYKNDDNNNRCSVHFVKRGSGTWRIENSTERKNSTGFTIEEGVLQFDDIAEKGESSGLGTAYDTHTNYFGAYNPDAKVPWVFALGTSDSEGALEYVGTNGAYSTGRTIGLAGAGRLSCESDAPLRFSGVMPIGEGAKTLTVAGSGTNENTIADIADAPAAPITLVKEGSGNWILANTNAIRGGLEVKAGRLTVRNPSGQYDWFRWTIRKTLRLYEGTTQRVQASQFGFYDSNLDRINCGWTHCDNFARIAPGQAAYQSRSSYTDTSNYMNELELGELFYPVTNRNRRWSIVMPKEMKPSSPGTHLKIVMRATNGAPEVARYDFSVRYPTSQTGFDFNPESWCLEGSRDGIHWDMLHDMPSTNATMFCHTSNNRYYAANRTSNGASNDPANPEKYNLTTTEKAPIIAGSTNKNINVMSGFSYVKVAEGAVLAADGAGLEISSLRIDSTGAGAIEGFSFARNGTLDVLGVENSGRAVLPGTYGSVSGFSNIANWSLTVDGESTRRRITVENGVIVLVNPGMRVILR